MKRKIIIGASLALLALGLAGCGDDAHQSSPTPTGDNIIKPDKVKVVQMPDGFRNVVLACYGTMLVAVTSASGADTLPSALQVTENSIYCGGGQN